MPVPLLPPRGRRVTQDTEVLHRRAVERTRPSQPEHAPLRRQRVAHDSHRFLTENDPQEREEDVRAADKPAYEPRNQERDGGDRRLCPAGYESKGEGDAGPGSAARARTHCRAKRRRARLPAHTLPSGFTEMRTTNPGSGR